MIACRGLSIINRKFFLRSYIRKVEAFPGIFQSCSCHRHSSSSSAVAHNIAENNNNTTTNHHNPRSTPYATNTPLYELNPHEIHLWWADPANFTSSLHLLQDLLPPEELQECQPTSPTSTESSERLVSRALLRILLSKYLAAQTPASSSSSMSLAKQLAITRNAYGKPDLQWPPCSNDTNNIHNKRLRFNVAHTCGLIGIAITSDRLIGLDIETAGRRTRHNPDTVARRRFSTMEYGNLNALLTDEEKAAYFIRLWTLKEAYVKAVGRGISAAPGLKSFSFSVEEGEDGGGGGKIRFSSEYPERIQWEFALLRPSDRHIAALCVQKTRNGGMPVSIKSFSMGVEGEGEETVVMTTVPLLARGHSD